MNRIEQKFKQLRAAQKKAFIPFITAGYPSIAMTEKLVYVLEDAGADIIELGVPFSDPLADGPTIQDASFCALKKGITLADILALGKKIRKRSSVPIALMTYYNPVFHFGEKRFCERAAAAGVDGIIIPDLPPEEAGVLISSARAHDIATVFFVSPTTDKKRVDTIARATKGFIYYVSVAGVTGARTKLPSKIVKDVRDIKDKTNKPVCVGFGISTPAQARAIAGVADGVIVGSAIIKIIKKSQSSADLLANVSRYVKRLTRVL